MTNTPTTAPRFVRDSAGKKASVRRTFGPADEIVGQDETWTWFVAPTTGRYYVVATEIVAAVDEPAVDEIAPKRRRKAKDSDLVFVPGVGTTLPAETPAKPKRAPKAAKSVEPKAIEAVKSISPSAAGRLGDKVGKDFIVRWPKSGADLLQRVAGEGAAWLVRCNAHGTTTEAANVKAADLAGRKAQRVVWCGECAAAAKA